MHVAVCIVGFRNPDDVVRCLAALERSTHRDFEVVVCENGGAEAHGRLVQQVPAALSGGQRMTVVKAATNLGFAGGVNVCLAERPGADAWWVLNPDTEPQPEAMARLVARLALGDCDAVGSTVWLSDGRVQSYGGRWRRWLAGATSIGYGASTAEAPDRAEIEARQNYLNGASILISRRFLEVVGPMREDYFLYCEEVEWCLRAIDRGLRLGFAPDAVVLHHQGTTMGSFSDLRRRSRLPVYLSERNRVLLTRDCYPSVLPVVSVALFGHILFRYLKRGAWRQAAYGLSGWVAGLAGERGAPRWLAR